MAYQFTNRELQPVGGNQYEVDIPGASLIFGVDEISGLGFGKVSTVSHRRSGYTSLYKRNYPVGIETPEVTFTGLYAYNFEDIDQLARWHRVCTGESRLVANEDLKRDITIKPIFRDYQGNSIDEENAPGQWALAQCLCVDLNISNFATEGADFSQWTMTVKPDRVDLILIGGNV